MQSKPIGRILTVKILKTPDDFELPVTKQWVVEVFPNDGDKKRFTKDKLSPLICRAPDCTDGYDIQTGRQWVNAASNAHIHPMIVMKGNIFETLEAAKETAKKRRVYYV